MRRFTVQYFGTLTETIGRLETKTSAELVVAIVPHSGAYRDADIGLGALLALVGLVVMLYGPWPHPEAAILADVLLLFAAGAWCSSALPAVRRAVTSVRRRQRQARDAAAASFTREDVWTTLGKTGILIYVSIMEREVIVIADRGVTTAVPPADWNDCLARLHGIFAGKDPPAALLQALEEVTDVLAATLPPVGDNPDELSNAPRSAMR